MLHTPVSVKFCSEAEAPLTADVAAISFKALAHQASYLSPSGKAGLAGQLVREELKTIRPTHLVAIVSTGASASNLVRALKATPMERVDLVAERITLAELAMKNDSAAELLDMAMPPVVKPRLSVEGMLAAYCELTPAERVMFAREIGVTRCWQPRQHHHAY